MHDAVIVMVWLVCGIFLWAGWLRAGRRGAFNTLAGLCAVGAVIGAARSSGWAWLCVVGVLAWWIHFMDERTERQKAKREEP